MLYIKANKDKKAFKTSLDDVVDQVNESNKQHFELTKDQKEKLLKTQTEIDAAKEYVGNFEKKLNLPNPSFQTVGLSNNYNLQQVTVANNSEDWLFVNDPNSPFYGGVAMGKLHVNDTANVHKLRFSNEYTNYSQNVLHGAEIANDTNKYKQLMFVGNNSGGKDKQVGVYDVLNVNGNLNVKGDAQMNGNVSLNKLNVMREMRIGGSPAATQEWINSQGRPKWTNIQGRPNITPGAPGLQGARGNGVDYVEGKLENNQPILIVYFSDKNVAPQKVQLNNAFGKTLSGIAVSDQNIIVTFRDGSKQTLPVPTIGSVSNYGSLTVGSGEKSKDGELTVHMANRHATKINAADGNNYLRGTETVFDSPLTLNKGIVVKNGSLCINNVCIDETKLKALLNRSPPPAPTPPPPALNFSYTYNSTPFIPGNVDTTSLIWYRNSDNSSKYWTGQGKPFWLCDSPPSNQAAKRTYEKIYQSTSFADVYCKFQFNTDNVGIIYLNNIKIGQSDKWEQTTTAYGNLKYGNNRIQLEITNHEPGNTGGGILSCVRNSDNTVLFTTDSSWKMNTDQLPSNISKVNGWTGNHENPLYNNKLITNQSEEMCRQKALNSGGKYTAWGHRNNTYPDPEWQNTCFLYTAPFAPFKGNVNDTAHTSGCLRPGEKIEWGCKTTKPPPPVLPDGIIALFGNRGSRYCADESSRVKCDRVEVDRWEKFNVTNLGDGTVAMRGGRDLKWCSDRPDGLVCNAESIGPWEKFNIEDLGDSNSFAMKGGREGLYCSDRPEGMVCNVRSRSDWEKLRYFKSSS
jgi:hypothetical protein